MNRESEVKRGMVVNGFKVLSLTTKSRKSYRKNASPYNETRCIIECLNCHTVKNAKSTTFKAGKVGCSEGPCEHRFEDLTGQKFGYLTAQEYIKTETSYHPWRWKCLCECGTERITTRKALKEGTKYCISCARKHSQDYRRLTDHEKKGWPRVLKEYQTGARQRGYKLELSLADVETLCKDNCYICDAPPVKDARHLIRNGIDRLDNDKGYTLDNCRSCCFFCNQAKHNHSLNDFLNHIKKIYGFSIKERSETIPEGSTPK